MNLLNFALGGLTGALTGSPLTAVTGIPIALALAGKGSPSAGGAGPTPSRDSLMSTLPDDMSCANLLQLAASSMSGDASQSVFGASTSLPTFPTSKPPAAVPTDDHGQSNVVFSDAGYDGAFVH